MKGYEQFGDSIFANGNIELKTKAVQSIYFHRAIFQTIERSFVDRADCDCTPHPGYFVGKTSFWCQEDYLVDPDVIIEAIEAKNDQLNPKIQLVYNYLQDNRRKERISYDKIRDLIEPRERFLKKLESYSKQAETGVSAVDECLQGDDLGCCGNYEGCCWLSSSECFWHDYQCLMSQCTPWWYCLPGCKYP